MFTYIYEDNIDIYVFVCCTVLEQVDRRDMYGGAMMIYVTAREISVIWVYVIIRSSYARACCVSVIHTDSEIRTISDLNIIISAMIVENHLWAGYLYSSVCVVSKFSHSHYYIVSLL